MRGSDTTTGSLFSYVDVEDRIPARHPLRIIRAVVNEALAALDAEFARIYAAGGRPSIAPEKLLRGSLLKAILAHPKVAPLLSDEHFSVDGTLVQAWASLKSFQAKASEPTGGADAPPPIAGRSGAPEPDGEAAAGQEAREQHEGKTEGADDEPLKTNANAPQEPAGSADSAPTTSADRYAAKKGRNAEVDFHGQKRSNATHASTTDPEARLYRKGPGKEARLCFMGHAMAENRHGLVVESTLTEAAGTAERAAAKDMIESHSPGSERRLTVGADKAYDTADFVTELRHMCVTPHVAQNTTGRCSAIDARTTRHAGYAVSQRKRKLIEEAFGWAKTIGGLAPVKLRGTRRMGFAFTLAMAAYNLIRLPKLIGTATA